MVVVIQSFRRWHNGVHHYIDGISHHLIDYHSMITTDIYAYMLGAYRTYCKNNIIELHFVPMKVDVKQLFNCFGRN